MNISQEEVSAAKAKLAAMITGIQSQFDELVSKLEARGAVESRVEVPAATLLLKPGERYAGIILGASLSESYHLIKLVREEDQVDWHRAEILARGSGVYLPNLREQALMFANIPQEFARDKYWSFEEGFSNLTAWAQDFGDGRQLYHDKNAKLHACAVRRVPL